MQVPVIFPQSSQVLCVNSFPDWYGKNIPAIPSDLSFIVLVVKEKGGKSHGVDHTIQNC